MLEVGDNTGKITQVYARDCKEIAVLDRGGPSEESNVLVLYGNCNREKSAKVDFANFWADNER